MWHGVQEAARRDRYPPALSLERALRPRCKIHLTSGPWRTLRLAPWPPQDRLPTCAGRKFPRASEPAHCPAISLKTAAAARGGQGQPDTLIGVDNNSPIGPQSQAQKVAAAISATEDTPAVPP